MGLIESGMKNRKSLFIDISEIKKLDFTKGKLKRDLEAIRKENKQLIENSRIDRQNLHLTFDI